MKKRSLLIFIILFLALCGFLIIAVNNFSIAQFWPTNTVNEFFKAHMNNDSNTLKRLTAKDQWDRIDNWILSHSSTTCDWNQEVLGPSMGMYSINDSSKVASINIVCTEAHSNDLYCLRIREINVQRIGYSWIVTDWDSIEEGCLK